MADVETRSPRTTRVLVLVAICAVAIAAWLWQRTRAEAPSRHETRATANSTPSGAGREPEVIEPVADLAERRVVGASTDIVEPVRPSAAVVRPRGRLPAEEPDLAPHVRTPAGVLEVAVFEDDEPMRNVPVAVVGPNVEALPERPEDVSDPTRWSRTDTGGLVRFEELPPGQYAIRAWIEPGSALTGHVELAETGAIRFYVRVGTGVVHGTVHESLGVPWSDALVELQLRANKGHGLELTTRTDAHGRFRFERLPSGFCIVTRQDWHVGPEVETGRARFQLDPGETIELSFGNLPLVLWTGTLRASSGEALEFMDEVPIDDAERGNEYVGRTDTSGRFRFALPAGDYLIGPEGGWGSPGFLHVALGPEPLERDLVVPGIVLRVTTTPGDFARYTLFELVPEERSSPPIEMRNELGTAAPGRERFAMRVPPARYRLRAKGSGVLAGAPPEGLPLDLTGRTGLVTIAVDLVPR